MAEQPQILPLLLFPVAVQPARRESLPPYVPTLALPSTERQNERLSPKFQQLQSTLEGRTLALQDTPGDNPELVLIIEIVGQVDDFIRAVRIDGLEWLAESFESDIEPNDDFYDNNNFQAQLNGRLFLLGSNLTALNQIISLWQRYVDNPNVRFEYGLGRWKEVFKHLKDIRFWSFQDRITPEIRQNWIDRINLGDNFIRFEIEAWCYSSDIKNEQSIIEIQTLIGRLGGTLINRAFLKEISYHGFLVEMPVNAVEQLLSNAPPELALSEKVMMFRLQGQGIADRENESFVHAAIEPPNELVSGSPIIALLDGLPLQNHPLLSGRVIVYDPDGWDAMYLAQDRVHGTAMSSLIAFGDLDGRRIPLKNPIYVRPILKPDINDFNVPKIEVTPNDVLLVDLVHRAVRRIFEPDGENPPVAPTVKVINLSIGDQNSVFDSVLSPWAKLIDWLSFKYNVLFIVSAGNVLPELLLDIPPDSLVTTQIDIRNNLTVKSLLSDSVNRRLISPAEAINALTIGASHSDSTIAPPPPLNFDLFNDRGISPFSRIGHGYSRAVKPDILFPGGKILFKEALQNQQGTTKVLCRNSSMAPGHRVATPPNGANNTKYTRGTSNSAALASRSAAYAYEVIESLRANSPDLIPTSHDAVLIKALLVHGAEWGSLKDQILNAFPHIVESHKKKDFISRNIGYGVADVDKALICTQQRATVIGTGALNSEESFEYRLPLPPSLRARTIDRKLTITLAWLSDINTKNAKYRSAKLWITPPRNDLEVTGTDCEWRHVRRGTLQHEISTGNHALPFVDGDELVFTVNCKADTGIAFQRPIPFALCVTLEVPEGINAPIYQEIRDRIQPRVGVVTR